MEIIDDGLVKVHVVFKVKADNRNEADGHVFQLASDYYKHYPDSKVESIELA